MIWGKILSFTSCGAETGRQIASALPEARMELYARSEDISLRETSLFRMIQQAMVDCNLLILIESCNAAVRDIAPYLQNAQWDAAVFVIDEGRNFVIPLLSGRLEHAADLARQLASYLGATAVLTEKHTEPKTAKRRTAF